MSTENPSSLEAADSVSLDPVEKVIRYHIRTKHHFNRYARSLGFLDWVNQPDPFRRFDGASLIPLPLLQPDEEPLSPAYSMIYEQGQVSPQPVTMRTLSRFFEFALAISAWKRAGESEWALRSNPSSGNLHPTEGYVLVQEMEGLALGPGLYHYAPKEHGLELRTTYSTSGIARLLTPFPPGAFLFGLTSIHWREAWKYGERAFRYCNHDVGHALGAARIAAATLGWKMTLLDGVAQNTTALLLGTNRVGDFTDADSEHPDCLCAVWSEARGEGPEARGSDKADETGAGEQRPKVLIPLGLDSTIVEELAGGRWHGKANRLSREHAVRWDIIDEAAGASWKTDADRLSVELPLSLPSPQRGESGGEGRYVPAGQIIRQRRSAVAFDGRTSIAAATFFRMLKKVMPCAGQDQLSRPVPWDIWPYEPTIHLMLFVHRVEALAPGLYFLVRDVRKVGRIRASLSPDLNWVPAPGCPEQLPLYWLLEGDAKRLASQVSCHQEIAGDSAFSLGMLAEFEDPLRERGAWWYPRMFWEAGLLGQVLYLEAEAAGVRGTGIGCFFDDPVHEIVAVKDLTLQSLYHFTIGGPVEDRRLQTLPPYGKREE